MRLPRWFPWRWVVSQVARARGFVDPVKVLSRLESFAQPLDVKEPLELLRAGLVFHARGLLNTGAIQHNLDWVWPFWVERQYDPQDVAFIPRAFSITHVNLTHRNWTAVGVPDFDGYPLVDPRGLVTPFWDGWSVDAWVLGDDGTELVPSRLGSVDQRLELAGVEGQEGLAVVTESRTGDLALSARAEAERHGDEIRLRLRYQAGSRSGGWLVLGLRPYNPEGVSMIGEISAAPAAGSLRFDVDGAATVELSAAPERRLFSRYRLGDVYRHLREPERPADAGIDCRVGMATAAALYRLGPGERRAVEATVGLGRTPAGGSAPSWAESLEGGARFETADRRLAALYDAALRTLVLASPGEVYPGPYTYKRFWFRDAAFILAGMLGAGLVGRVERCLDLYPARQNRRGHFYSQDGEWDSNGEALWILERFTSHTGSEPKPGWRRAVGKGGRWIAGTRVRSAPPESPHAGLMPAGFSAEHLGPNDFYYWDDFWSIAGLRSAAALEARYGDAASAARFGEEAADLERAVERSLAKAAERIGRPAMPASAYRRLDSGAIGSLAAGYPLQLFAPADPRLADTAAFLLDQCLVRGGFFLDMIHSGINPYLTLHMAQVLLRASDPRAADLIRAVADLASPTGQWPEAVHPHTGGGCMGDGQHVWAAAEWVLAVRNSFVREEGDGLVLAAGLPGGWLGAGREASFGPTPTPFGPLTVGVRLVGSELEVEWTGVFRAAAPRIRVHPLGGRSVEAPPGATRMRIAR